LVNELVCFFLGEPSPNLAELFKNDDKVLVMRVKMGTDLAQPNFADLTALLSTLVCGCVVDMKEAPLAPSPTLLTGQPFTMSARDRQHVLHRPFVSKLMKTGANSAALAKMLAHLSWRQPHVSREVLDMCVETLDIWSEKNYPPIFAVLSAVFELQDNLAADRLAHFFPQLMEVVQKNLEYVNAVTECVKFVHKLSQSNALVAKWLLVESNRARWRFLEQWVPPELQ